MHVIRFADEKLDDVVVEALNASYVLDRENSTDAEFENLLCRNVVVRKVFRASR